MTTRLSISEVEKLVEESAGRLGRGVTSNLVHVYEEPNASNGEALIVQIALRRPSDQRSWSEERLRLSQSIRDALVQSGDERYPLLQIFEPNEWIDRDE